MPLRCFDNQFEVAAYELDKAAWAHLAEVNKARHHLKMHCCGAPVVLKRSSLGTQFFAHSRRGDCTTAKESMEHLYAKSLVASAFAGTKWLAKTEVSGTTPDGELWVADVLAVCNEKKIAIEIQWSPQTADETLRRQERYAKCGIRGLWLFRKPSNLLSSKETPAFLLNVDTQEKQATVKLQSKYFSSFCSRDCDLRDERNWAQEIELQQFIRGAMKGCLIWAPGLERVIPLDISAAPQRCWKCHKPTRIVTNLAFRVDKVFSGARVIGGRLSEFDSAVGKKCLFEAISSINLRGLGIGDLKDRYSRTVGASYLSNGCVHCDALQGAFFDHEVVNGSEVVASADCLMTEGLFSEWSQMDTPYYWWFDKNVRT